MTQSTLLQELRELRQFEKTITEKTGYRTKINFVKDDEGNKNYQVHVSADDKTWKYVYIPFEDVDVAYAEFMYSLLQCPNAYTTYSVGSYGLILENALEAHSMGDLGYNVSHGNLMYLEETGDSVEPVALCACKDITKMTVETNSDGELAEIVVIANSKKIVITDDRYKID